MVNNREKQLEVEEIFCTTCRRAFLTEEMYDDHFITATTKEACTVIRDAGHDQFRKKGPMKLEKRLRVLQKQLKEAAKNQEEGEGDGNKKKKGNQGKKGKKNKKK